MPVTTVLVMVLLKLMEALVQFISLGHGAGGVGKWGRGGGRGGGGGGNDLWVVLCRCAL